MGEGKGLRYKIQVGNMVEGFKELGRVGSEAEDGQEKVRVAMKVLELFAGSRSFAKVCNEDDEVFSVDIKGFDGIDLEKDIEFLRPEDIPFTPDFIWASPPCTTFSIAAISHHRDGQRPKSEFARKSDRLVQSTLNLINYYDCLYCIENPVGMLRKMEYMNNLPKTTVTYCSYGDKRMKPTDIWCNFLYSLFNPKGWYSRPICHNGNQFCHHESAPRGSKTGTQGLKGNYDRSKIPEQLCREIYHYAKINLG